MQLMCLFKYNLNYQTVKSIVILNSAESLRFTKGVGNYLPATGVLQV